MEYVNLGRSGLKVSRLALGMMSYGTSEWRPWVLDEADAEPFVRRALELGINFFDTADMYSRGVSEEVTGRLLGRLTDRDEVAIATKVFFPMSDDPNDRGLGRKHILASIDRSLRRLQTDHVDVYWIHRWDPDTPIEETMEALHDVVRAGKARYLGASSMYAWQLAKAQHVASVNGWTRFAAIQPHYNLLYREEEREILPLARDQGLGVMPWSPLARGRLARPPGDDATARAETDDLTRHLYDEAGDEIVERVHAVAERRDVSAAQVALAWLLHQGAVTAPIIGATQLDHLEQAVAATEVDLSVEDLAELEEPYVPRPVLGH